MMSLLEKAQTCIQMSQELLLRGNHAGALAYALQAAQYLQLIRLLRQQGPHHHETTTSTDP